MHRKSYSQNVVLASAFANCQLPKSQHTDLFCQKTQELTPLSKTTTCFITFLNPSNQQNGTTATQIYEFVKKREINKEKNITKSYIYVSSENTRTGSSFLNHNMPNLK